MKRKTLAIVGPSRAGKDTLAQAIVNYAHNLKTYPNTITHETDPEPEKNQFGPGKKQFGTSKKQFWLGKRQFWLGKNECSYKKKLMTKTCSHVICEHISHFLGVSYECVWEGRHRDVQLWRWYGDWLRREDPCFLVRECVRRGADIVVGIRSVVEMDASISEGLIDAVVWVDRPGVGVDPALEFGYRPCWDYVYNGARSADSLIAVAESLYFRHLTKC